MELNIPYGKTFLPAWLPEDRPIQVLRPALPVPELPEHALLQEALRRPCGSPPLEALSREKRTALIITSDHTRPVPSKQMMPLLLDALRRGNPDIEITILIAAGCHRATTREELLEKFGQKIVEEEHIVQHDASDAASLAFLGQLPSGHPLYVNRLALETDLLIAEGFIEPHFFAGFSGGRKSILPGIAGKTSILCNHNARFIDSPCARAGSLERNPIHLDMQAAARMAGLAFIFNVILNEEKRVVAAYAGEPEAAHLAGCRFLSAHAGVTGRKTPIVLTSNGGYPLDQNIYQCVKGLSTAESICTDGGVIILCAACSDGHGGAAFYQRLRQAASPRALLAEILQVPAAQTTPDQWQYQILARILCHHTVILVTRPELADMVRDMKMAYAPDIQTALEQAEALVGSRAPITVIPDGVGAFVTPEVHPEA